MSGASQSQCVNLLIENIEQTGPGKWRFKASAKHCLVEGDFYVPAPVRKLNTSAGDGGKFDTGTIKTTSSDIVNIQGANALTINFCFRAAAYYEAYDKGRLRTYLGASKNQWRICYRATGTTNWSCSGWSPVITTAWNDRETHSDMMTISFPQGNYEARVEYKNEVITSGGCLFSFSPGDPRIDLVVCGWFELSRITLNSAANTLLANGSLNYIAVGE